jgi:hypothetical protein
MDLKKLMTNKKDTKKRHSRATWRKYTCLRATQIINLKTVVNKSGTIHNTLSLNYRLLEHITHNSRLCPQRSFVLSFILFILYTIFIEMELIS